jgi:CelD/BcsL family acetyltransferase involved in cellulose biosynthesis
MMEMGMDSALRVVSLRTIQEIESIRKSWESLQWHPNSDIDFYLRIVSLRSEVKEPLVLVVYRGDLVVAIVVGRVELTTMEARLGYLRLPAPCIRVLSILHGGILGNLGQAGEEAVARTCHRLLVRRQIDAVVFSDLRRGCGLIEALRPGSRLFRPTTRVVAKGPHWSMQKPEDLDSLLQRMSAKRRYQMRRHLRRLEAVGGVELLSLRRNEQVGDVCRMAERIASKTYLRGLGAGFVCNNEMWSRLSLCAARDWLRAYFLLVHGEPVAFWLGTLYKGTLHLDYTGFDPEYGRYEVGTACFLKMIAELGDEVCHAIDFGQGDALYKKLFGDRAQARVSLYAFSWSLGAKLSELSIMFSIAGRALAERLDRGLRASRAIKRLWRRAGAQSSRSRLKQAPDV